jgi:hypothetical protein
MKNPNHELMGTAIKWNRISKELEYMAGNGTDRVTQSIWRHSCIDFFNNFQFQLHFLGKT